MSIPISQQGQLRTVQDFKLIELKSTYGISALRDNTVVAEGGTVTNTVGDGEYRVRVQASGDTALLQSAEYGRYIPGYDASVGVGIRVPTSPGGDNYFEWGLGDGTNALLFGVDATGIYINRRRATTDNKVYQSSWNADKLDGSGPSGISFALVDGNIFQIEYTWYGYGVISWKVVVPDGDSQPRDIVVHREKVNGSTSIANPNLPIRAYGSAGTTAADLSMYVGGRQYTIVGRYEPNFRVTSDRVLQKGSIGETFLPIMTVRRKTAYKSVSVKLDAFDVIADVNMVLEVRINATLGGTPSYGAFPDIAATETGLERDVAASSVSGGQVVWRGLAAGSNRSPATRIDLPTVDLPQDATLTFCARRVVGSNGTLDSVMSLREEW